MEGGASSCGRRIVCEKTPGVADKNIIKRTQDTIFDAKAALRTVIEGLKTVNDSLTEYEAWIKIFQVYSLF